MYILELFINWLNKNKRGKGANPDKNFSNDVYIADDTTNCRHSFMPIDSSGDILSCIYCGYIIKKNEKNKG